VLTTELTYVDNKLFSSEDPYGRKTYYAYDATDARLIRTVTCYRPRCGRRTRLFPAELLS